MNFSSKNIEGVLEHKQQVGFYMNECARELFHRAVVHDYSKLSDEEHPYFEEATEQLKDLEYGSQEYKDALKIMKPAIDHHYAYNPHHPEFFHDGLHDMNLFDIMEMVCDWMAAVKRHDDGDIWKSLAINKDRFNIDNQTYNIIYNTVKKLEED